MNRCFAAASAGLMRRGLLMQRKCLTDRAHVACCTPRASRQLRLPLKRRLDDKPHLDKRIAIPLGIIAEQEESPGEITVRDSERLTLEKCGHGVGVSVELVGV